MIKHTANKLVFAVSVVEEVKALVRMEPVNAANIPILV